jgi:hypothetical protein
MYTLRQVQEELPIESYNIGIPEKVTPTKAYYTKLFIMFLGIKLINTTHAAAPNDLAL